MRRIMKIHREGYKIIAVVAVILLAINAALYWGLPHLVQLRIGIGAFSLAFFFFVVAFFRNPFRLVNAGEREVIAPADGKVVVVEEVDEGEYFKDKRIQVSIFMSPANVHVNRNPISGTIKYTKYHPGMYLVAWHPKSSTQNEHNSVVIQNNDLEILVRQIAGKLARRIVSYCNEGDQVEQGGELGFIKFGSRVDIFLPLDADIKVNLKQKVKGGKTVIATLE